MDKLFIRELRVPAQVGLLLHEKNSTQTLIVDVSFEIDLTAAAASDDITHAVDYAVVRQSIIDFLAKRRFQLMETLADQLVNFLMQEFSLSWIQLSAVKLGAFSDAAGAGVMVERSSRQ